MVSLSSKSPIRYIKGVGARREGLLNLRGIYTVEDILYYFPRRYEDRKHFSSIASLSPGGIYTVRVSVRSLAQRISFRRRKFSLVEIIAEDDTGSILCVWFNRGYLKNYLHTGDRIILHGKVDYYGKRLQFSSPELEIISPEEEESLSAGRIVPVYSLPSGIGQRYFRKTVKYALDSCLPGVRDFLPYDMRSRRGLDNLARSLLNIHFPEGEASRLQACRRLSFDEFFFFQLPLAVKKSAQKREDGIRHPVEGELSRGFISSLPFRLTAGQLQCLEEIKRDMSGARPMRRLLQGDVGSGKTVLALIAALISVQGGHQAAMIAPTEILAKQHFEKISRFLSGMPSLTGRVSCVLLAGALKAAARTAAEKNVRSGSANLVIGTHTLLNRDVVFRDLGLIVIDEQHKFGVKQRAVLNEKGGGADVLLMTATPIPRTLAITLYGDLDVSVLREMPPGRQAVATLCADSSAKGRLYARMREHVKQGRQVFIVYPLVEESAESDILSVKSMYEELRKNIFPDFRIGMVHGKMKSAQQDKVMEDFRLNKLDVLVSTTILEVGIDVPNATMMMVENAERFGLSQLHQLRGRVGRGAYQSVCVLVSDAKTEDARARLSAMARYGDGFRIAEEDLKIRGPGEFFGNRQHGLSELKIADPLTQMQLLRHARSEALRITAVDPLLSSEGNICLKEELEKRFPGYEKVMMIG
ncbi:MAG: ATP-dependent DNA helicase RecG [Candidatus Omnitrophota bacterium]